MKNLKMAKLYNVNAFRTVKNMNFFEAICVIAKNQLSRYVRLILGKWSCNDRFQYFPIKISYYFPQKFDEPNFYTINALVITPLKPKSLTQMEPPYSTINNKFHFQ